MAVFRVPATTANLGPGFDTLGLALKIYNYVSICPTAEKQGLVIDIKGEGEKELPRNQQNLVYRAARRLFDETGYDPGGLYIRQVNGIPLCSGLGSSSAAIIGGMLAANYLLPSPLDRQDILSLAAELEGHPDNVAPALLGGFVATCQVGERVKALSIRPPFPLRAVIAVPQISLSTKEARELLPRKVPLEDAVYNISRVAFIVAAFTASQVENLSWAMEDRLHQPYREPLVPGMMEVFKSAREAGALSVFLSGAGPSIIAFCSEASPAKEKKIGEAMSGVWRRYATPCRLFYTGVELSGGQLVSECSVDDIPVR